MKKVLILGGSHRDIPLIKASQDLGYFVITLGNKDYYLGHNYSNKAYKINFNDLNMVKKILAQSNDKERYSRLYELIDRQTAHTLLTAVEATKMRLTEKEMANIALNFMSKPFSVNANRQDFEASIMQNINKISSGFWIKS